MAIGVAALACIGLLSAGYGVYRARYGDRFPRAIRDKSVAVVPFENFSREPDTEYLSDGLTEEITTALGHIQGLKVAARNSAFSFKGKNRPAQEIAKALKVSTILTGSIRKDNSRLRVSAYLVNAADGFQLWSENYNGSIDDILTMQQDIAARIAKRLEARADLSGSRRKMPAPEVHRTYLLARHFWNKRTESGLTNAIQLFRATLEKDPLYSEAYSGLAASYLVLPNYAPVRRKQYYPLARAAAQEALKLDPSCAEAHGVFAQLEWSAGDLAGAEEHYQQALEVDPNYATARHWYGQFLTVHGRAEEGLAQLRAAVDLDPLSPIIRNTIPEWHYLNGDAERAVQEARDVIEMFADFPVGRVMLSYALISKGMHAEARSELERARTIAGNVFFYLDVTAYALARSGKQAEAREILARYEQMRAEGKSVDSSLALIYTGLREYDKAIEALERLADTDLLEDTILCDPFYRELVSLPRFEALARKAGLKRKA